MLRQVFLFSVDTLNVWKIPNCEQCFDVKSLALPKTKKVFYHIVDIIIKYGEIFKKDNKWETTESEK